MKKMPNTKCGPCRLWGPYPRSLLLGGYRPKAATRILYLLCYLIFAACSPSSYFPGGEDTFDQTVNKNPNSNNLNRNRTPSGPLGELSAANSVSFVTFGDWGSGRSEQRDVADAIGSYCIANRCDFILTLGDNFYSNGVESVNDRLWETYYHAVYDFLNLPFYVALGNHDTYGNIQAEIDYSAIDPDWHLPAQAYTFSKPDGVAPPLAQFFIFNSEGSYFDGPTQTWLDQTLSASNARWKLLAMHHPLYSNGSSHGDGDSSYRRTVVPIICNRIDLVLSGHDHDFAHMRSNQDDCPIEQFVIGTGGQEVHSVDRTDPRAVASSGDIYGFGWFQVSQNQIEFRMIDTAGRVFYQTTFTKP